MSLPKTYRHAVFKEVGGPLVLEDTELNLPVKGEVLIKVEACGICYSDTMAQHNVMGAGFPFVPGHEIIGHVVVIPDGETRWRVGDRVGGGWHGGHDGTCKACQKGLNQMCDNAQVNGETRAGGYAQYCTLRSEAVVRIPTNVDAAQYAPILCAGTSVFNSIRQTKTTPGSVVAIQGLGGLGHLAIQYANKFGYRVVALSRGTQKEKFARDLGAHEYIDTSKVDVGKALQELGGASLIVTTAPSVGNITPLIQGLGLLGKLLFLSVPGNVLVDTAAMLRYGNSIQVWPSGHAVDSEEAIQFTELSNVNCLVEKFPLERVNDAYGAMLSGKVRFRAVLTME